MFGAVETGGTKFICAIGKDTRNIVAKEIFPTMSPQETIDKVGNFFNKQSKLHGPVSKIGVGSFGPVDISLGSKDYGKILFTPKLDWKGFNIAKAIEEVTTAKVVLNTDVNCALLGEMLYGAGQGLKDVIYLTIGTGIGGGIMVDGKVVHGFSHPELGHMMIPKHHDDHFTGICPYHADKCIEGLASGPAIEQRWGINASKLDPQHPAWDLQGYYVAVFCINLLLLTAPQRIILGGGVMRKLHLFPVIYKEIKHLLGDYFDIDSSKLRIEDIIVAAMEDNVSGIHGCLLLAEQHEPNCTLNQQTK